MKIAVVLLAALSSVAWSAQVREESLTLSGVVEDSKTHEPIADAKVSLPGIQAVHEDYTDSGGVFTLELSSGIKPGMIVRLRVEKDGYQTYEEKMSVAVSLARRIPLTAKARKTLPSRPRSSASRKLSVRGYVTTGDGAALVGAQVLIRGGPAPKETDKTGGFLIEDIVPPPDVGFPATFQVIGWIIDDPFYLSERGSTYLPDPKAPPIRLLVRKPGDQAFLQGASIEKILSAKVFDLSDDEKEDAAPLANGACSLPGSLRPSRLGVTSSSAYLPVAVRLAELTKSDAAPGWAATDWDEFLKVQAEVIRIPLPELRAAIDKWITHVDNVYQDGLASLYRGNYEVASSLFHKALDSHDATKEQLYAAVAYAEYKRGNFSESSKFLEKLTALHPEDAVFRRSLEFVHVAAHRTAKGSSSEERDRKRLDISREVMGNLVRHESSSITSLLEEHLVQSGGDKTLEVGIEDVTRRLGSFKLVQRQWIDYKRGLYITKSQFEKAPIELIIRFNDHDLITWASLSADEEGVRAKAETIRNLLVRGRSDEVLGMFDGSPSQDGVQNVKRAVSFATVGLRSQPEIKLDPALSLATIVLSSPSGTVMLVTVDFGLDLRVSRFRAVVAERQP